MCPFRWLSVDLGKTFSIDSVSLSNRYCGNNPSDPLKCLCKLSFAKVSLVDSSGTVVQSKMLGDTCGMLYVDVDFGCTADTDMPTEMPTFFPTFF